MILVPSNNLGNTVALDVLHKLCSVQGKKEENVGCHMVAMKIPYLAIHQKLEIFWKQLLFNNKIVGLGIALGWLHYLKVTGAVP